LILWQCVRLPLLLLLTILEPVASFALGLLALVGVLMSLFWWELHLLPPTYQVGAHLAVAPAFD
jgi:hypothetical protein